MLDNIDVIALDYDMKIKLLERIAQEILNKRIEFARISGRYAELKAEIQILKEGKSAIQSALKAESSQ